MTRTQHNGTSRDADIPLVSIVVRSMGRPELRLALESIARQDYPAIEAIVVDATGGQHPALPALPWRAGHTLRMVTRPERLPRPIAANVGLATVSGSWFMFLDDDDTCEPGHVSTLVTATRAHPGALVVYGSGRLFDAEGREMQVFGRPFNRALMHYGPLFYWQAALISTRVRDLGCRFDPTLAVCEDRDFLAQIAQHGDFAFLPSVATFNYRPDLGTSGTGRGANRDTARVARFENLLRAKWAGPGTLHNERVALRCRQGVRAYFAGDLERARAIFAGALAEYPDDPNALHGLARVAMAMDRLDDAQRLARKAAEMNPQAAEYRATLSEIDARKGASAVRTSARGLPSRLALCSCGSGRRYKECCGRLEIAAGRPVAIDEALDRVNADLERGNAYAARDWLRTATAAADASRERLITAARLELDLDEPKSAFPLLERAAAIRVDAEAGLMLDACCAALARRERHASLWSTIDALVAPPPSASPVAVGPAASRVRIVVPGSDPRRIEQASSLHAALGDDAELLLVGQGDGALAPTPVQTLALFDADMAWDPESETSPARVVVRLTRDDPEALLRALTRLRDAYPHAQLQFTRPFEDVVAPVAGAMPVEYPWIGEAPFAAALPEASKARIAIGRAGPPDISDDHPNDPALYRRLMEDGYRVVVPATSFLRRAFRDDAPALRPELTEGGELGDPANLPDVMLFRGRPGRRGDVDARVLAAMAAARPVIVFAQVLGAREWIEQGRTGYVVESEEDARRRIDELARDAALRRKIGLAARGRAAAVMHAQRDRARAFYLGVSVNE